MKKFNMEHLEKLADKNKSGKEIDWKGKKLKNLELAESYKRLGLKKAYRVEECGTLLSFKIIDEDLKKLFKANFCKDRLCPMCTWRRSMKIFGQVSKVMDRALEDKEYRFLFLTLTVRNCTGEELSNEIDRMFNSLKLLFQRKEVKKIVIGFFRGLEVTYNEEYDTYHPHFHIILMVNKSYFKKSDKYLTQKDWTNLWKDCLKVDYTPIVNVKAFKTASKEQTRKSICEVAKYTVKDNDYLFEDIEMTDNTVAILNNALKSRRLIAFGKKFRKIHKELNLDDAEKGDLINTDVDDTIRPEIEEIIENYKWNFGVKQYFKF
ncbi:protein rep (plasmid) [Clostridium perfringens]|uniref:protein rep n=1 Tax=Clostridium perfringens TaxID=1502 RepID=UPI0013E3FD5B|nr:protein rep [Clostridium perfringens]NGT68505.1 protein rep [Clostridium perfringens]